MIIKSCAFTGHRPHKFPWKYDEADSRCLALKTALREQIICLADVGITNFYSGMAEGTDIWAAEIVLELCNKGYPLQLHCVLPCEGQADRWSEAARQRYCNILAQANSSEYVSREYQKDCMLQRNRRLVERAGILLAVYNGEYRGGTAATVRYAQKMQRRIVLIDPHTTACLTEFARYISQLGNSLEQRLECREEP